jgi:hypothetical protein
MPSGRKGSGPNGQLLGTGFGERQISARIRRERVDELYEMLKEERMSLQDFFSLCVEAYVQSNPRMRGLVEAWRRESQVSKKEVKNVTLPQSEIDDILREIEQGSDVEGE